MGINKAIWTAYTREEAGFGFTLYELQQKVKRERGQVIKKKKEQVAKDD